jgi:hypothetical protein
MISIDQLIALATLVLSLQGAFVVFAIHVLQRLTRIETILQVRLGQAAGAVPEFKPGRLDGGL